LPNMKLKRPCGGTSDEIKLSLTACRKKLLQRFAIFSAIIEKRV